MFESLDMWTLLALGIGAVLYYLRKYSQGDEFKMDDLMVTDKVIIITGANTGIGKEIALDLAKRGARIYMACRNYDKCEQTKCEIIQKTNNPNVFNRQIDLASLKSIREFVNKTYYQGPQYENDGIIIPGKVVIITGCNSGIGKEVATELAKRSAIIYMACRDTNKCEKARLEIIKKTGNPNLINRQLDLASMASIRAFVDGFEEKKLDILINNAAVMHCPKSETKDGFELQFGTNHLGHFLLTMLLLDKLKLGSPSRILNITCNSYVWGYISRFDLMAKHNYSSIKAYSQSKLAIMLFTIKLAEILESTGVMVCSVNPGQVYGTELYRHRPFFRILMSPINLFLRTPKSGSQTIIAAALEPKFKNLNGGYFKDCDSSKPYSHALIVEDAEWLFNKSEQLTKLKE